MNRKKLLPLIALVLAVALTGCAAIQGYFNKLTGSLFGKGYTITQYDDCSIEIPSDLPKTTLVHIDGKMVYVHRANVDIIPAELLED